MATLRTGTESLAADLAQMTVWIGYLQWTRDHGYLLLTIRSCGPPITFDAATPYRPGDPEHPKEPEWPEVDFIVGNPPFLADKVMRGSLGDEYVAAFRKLYAGRLPGQSDLCCYWFEKATEAHRGREMSSGRASGNAGYPGRSKPGSVEAH